ncbi:uncharacterized protein ACMZJ9_005042 [Mantella aurantiaca]
MPGDIDVDVDDLERELNEILQEKDIDLPEVPTGPLIAGIISPKRLPAVQNTGVSAFDMSEMAMAVSTSPDRLPYAISAPSNVTPERNRGAQPQTRYLVPQ